METEAVGSTVFESSGTVVAIADATFISVGGAGVAAGVTTGAGVVTGVEIGVAAGMGNVGSAGAR